MTGFLIMAGLLGLMVGPPAVAALFFGWGSEYDR
jgi:hypothetical protein